MRKQEEEVQNRRPTTFTILFTALIALACFFAGYSVRTARTAVAQAPAPDPSFDGNPSGHYMVPRNTGTVSDAAKAELAKCLKVIAATRLAVIYVTAMPGQPPHDRKPTCAGKTPCVQFMWKDMQLTTHGPAPSYQQNGPETLDVYGTLSLK